MRNITYKIGPKTIDNKKNNDVGWKTTFEQRGKRYFISFHLIFLGKSDGLMMAGQNMYLKLDNGKILTLLLEKETVPTYLAAPYGVYSHYTPSYEMDKMTVLALSKSYITDMKFTIGNSDITAELDERRSGRLMNGAECLLNSD